MRITGPGIWGPPADHDGAIAVLRRVVEIGVDFIDTADSYGPAVSEELIFEALHPYGHVQVATKAGLLRTGPGVWIPCGRPDYLRQECEMSLRRLGVEALDLFQLHRIDPTVDVDEQFGLLAALYQEGKVRAVGLSNVTAGDLERARGIVEITSVQNLYNLTNRSSETVLHACEASGIGFIPWFPVASGALALPDSPVAAIAAETGATTSQVSLAWLLAKSPVMLPIPGTSSVAHAEENCGAAQLTLTAEQVATLSALAPAG
jgi:aryl-alcohol dehydrogenase-like predicted oxidoreductase